MIAVEINNQQSFVDVESGQLQAAVELVFAGEGIPAAEVSIALIDNASIRELNARYLGHDYATDVLSFLLDREGLLVERWGAIGRYLDFPDRLERNIHVPTQARPGLREVIGPLIRQVADSGRRCSP